MHVKYHDWMDSMRVCAMQSLEAMQGVVQQEMKGLKAERSSFRDLVHDAKWAASQGAAPDQAPVSCTTAVTCLLPISVCIDTTFCL